MSYLIVGTGGIFGAISRYVVGKIFRKVIGKDHPIATFFINTTGSFLIGYLSAKYIPYEYKLFFIAGFLGSFTTYSTFMFEVSKYIKNKKFTKAFIYLFSSIIFGILSVGIGIGLAKILSKNI